MNQMSVSPESAYESRTPSAMVLGVLDFNTAGVLSTELAPWLEEETGVGVVV